MTNRMTAPSHVLAGTDTIMTEKEFYAMLDRMDASGTLNGYELLQEDLVNATETYEVELTTYDSFVILVTEVQTTADFLYQQKMEAIAEWNQGEFEYILGYAEYVSKQEMYDMIDDCYLEMIKSR